MTVDRYDLIFAYKWYSIHYAPVDEKVQRTLYRLRVRLGPCQKFEDEPPELKEMYGRIVRKREGIQVAIERFARRSKWFEWPGTANVGNARTYLQRLGLLDAVLTYIE